MPLHLRPMLDRDVDAFERILDSAFSNSLMPLFWPSGKSASARAHNRAKTLKELHESPEARINVVYDSDLPPEASDYSSLELSAADKVALEKEGRVVGVGYWKMYEKDRSLAELDAEDERSKEDGFPEGFHAEMAKSFFGALGQAKREELGGRRHCLLHILVTDPEHHRRGIGALHLRWGLDEADRLGLPAYLEASANGAPLYARWGFEAIRMLDWDSREWGSKERIEHTLMLRPARGSEKSG